MLYIQKRKKRKETLFFAVWPWSEFLSFDKHEDGENYNENMGFYHFSFQVGTFSDAGVVDNFKKRRASFIPDVLFKHSLVLTINNFSLFLYCSLLVLLNLVKTEEPPFRTTSTTLSTVSVNKAS